VHHPINPSFQLNAEGASCVAPEAPFTDLPGSQDNKQQEEAGGANRQPLSGGRSWDIGHSRNLVEITGKESGELYRSVHVRHAWGRTKNTIPIAPQSLAIPCPGEVDAGSSVPAFHDQAGFDRAASTLAGGVTRRREAFALPRAPLPPFAISCSKAASVPRNSGNSGYVAMPHWLCAKAMLRDLAFELVLPTVAVSFSGMRRTFRQACVLLPDGKARYQNHGGGPAENETDRAVRPWGY
jgi:hypothetical protein